MEKGYAGSMDGMIADIRAEYGLTYTWTGRKKPSQAVIDAMSAVPRHRFVPPEFRSYSYDNMPLPIGFGQTISQPYIVAIMTDLLQIRSTDRVLEVGTGSGYQTSILALLGSFVYTIEIVRQLSETARTLLKELGCGNVAFRMSDGHFGWPEEAPFHRVMVTAAAEAVPDALVDQLQPQGRMIVPVGSRHGHQELVLIQKSVTGTVREKRLLGVSFVPLTDRRNHAGHLL